jgi:UDP-GlcNAc3NAcA epimerase
MYDAALYYGVQSPQRSDIIKQLGLNSGEFVLSTIHRQENTDTLENLKSIIQALNEINNTKRVILPLHPRTRKILELNNLDTSFTLIEPVGYFDIIELLKHCSLVITDSGGMQKEAYFFSKFCITVRKETEWIELVNNQYNYLAGTDQAEILKAFNEIQLRTFSNHHRFYGEGNASREIIDSIS